MPRDVRGRPRPDLQRPREIVVRADPGTNALIVDAPVQRLAGFEALVQQLDQRSVPEDLELRTYRVERADLDAVATTLRGLAASDVLSGNAPGAQGLKTPVTIATEPVSRTLVVSGPGTIFDEVERVLRDLDAPPERPALALRMHSLEHARAERLQPLLDRLLTARLREQQETDGRVAIDVESLLDVASDGATNTLIISAPQSIQEIAAELIATLDSPAAAVGRSVVRVVPLVYAEAQQTARTLGSALPTMELPSGGRPTVMATTGSNALLLSGAAADLDAVEELLKSLDVRPVNEDAIDIATFKLEHADAARIAATVERLIVEQQQTDPRIIQMQLRYRRGEMPQIPRVRVELDSRTNALIVSGPAASLELARTIIDRLDQPADGPERVVQSFTPARARAEALVESAKRVLEATGSEGPRPVELVAEPSSGSVLVIGDPAEVAAALQTLTRLDERAVMTPDVELRTFNLAHASASAVAGTLQRLLGDRARWPEALLAARTGGRRRPPTHSERR